MKIASLELFKVPPRWLFLKITTDDGLCGWGEPIVEGRADTTLACVQEMESYLIGRDPCQIEDLWQTIYRAGFYRGGPVLTSALSGIEQALWDIKGKKYGLPAYAFLGGSVRERVQVYSGLGGSTPQECAQLARARYDIGYRAVKMGTYGQAKWIDSMKLIDEVVESVAAVREAMGNDMDIAIDFHGRVHKSMARMLIHELEPYRLMFIEEPVLTDNEECFAELRQHTSTPIATGERNYTRWGFKRMLQEGGVDIIQPDLSHAGGIWECRKIAAMAECYDVAVAPHCPLGPIALAACLQLDFCTPNAFIQEQAMGVHDTMAPHFAYLKNPDVFAFQDGCVPRLSAPGLGIEIDEAVVREQAKIGHTWKNPVWRDSDGCVCEW